MRFKGVQHNFPAGFQAAEGEARPVGEMRGDTCSQMRDLAFPRVVIP